MQDSKAEELVEPSLRRSCSFEALITDDERVDIDLIIDEYFPHVAETKPDLGQWEIVEKPPPPRLSVLILVVGSQGDVNPFVSLAQELKKFGHRVRLATHSVFREFVEENGIEFFPLAGDPKELMAFMVKTGGRLLPTSLRQLKEDIPAKRRMIFEILQSTWRAATEPDGELGKPFRADSIIANPPSYGHLHVAEALQIPVHLFFTMPWSSTRSFPHPLANMKYSSTKNSDLDFASVSVTSVATRVEATSAGSTVASTITATAVSAEVTAVTRDSQETIKVVSTEASLLAKTSPLLPPNSQPTASTVVQSQTSVSQASHSQPPANKTFLSSILSVFTSKPNLFSTEQKSPEVTSPDPSTSSIVFPSPSWGTINTTHFAKPEAGDLLSNTHPEPKGARGAIGALAAETDLKLEKMRGLANVLSYSVMDFVIWMGIGDLVNQFRSELHLKPIQSQAGAHILQDLSIPFCYLWSPSLIPKPLDWGPHIDVVGFCSLEGSGMAKWEPSGEVRQFLAELDHRGKPRPKPIFVGFGSCVVENPDKLVTTITAAAEAAEVRIVLQAGWAGLSSKSSDNVMMIGSAPHDVLFRHVAAVCHHGGAGTTVAGLRAGLPTIVVPFFGDQPFWGQMVANCGAGPQPIPITKLSKELLTNAFRFVYREDVKTQAVLLSKTLLAEQGATGGLRAFHRQLPSMACDLDSSRVARVECPECDLKLSWIADHVVHIGERSNHQRAPYKICHWDLANAHASETRESSTGMLNRTMQVVKRGTRYINQTGQRLSSTPVTHERDDSGDAKHVGEGLSHGASDFLSDVVDGVGGVIREPMKEIDRLKVSRSDVVTTTASVGVAVGKGLVGLVLKPIGGGLKLLAQTTMGVLNTPQHVLHKLEPTKVALPAWHPPAAPIEVSERDKERLLASFASVQTQRIARGI